MNEVIQSIKSKLSFALRHLIHFRPHSIKWRSLSSLIPKLLSILGPRPAGPSPLAAGARPRLARLRIPSNLTKALSFETYIKRLSFVNRAGFASSVALFIISLLIIFPIYYKTNLAEAADGSSSTVLSISSDNLTATMDLLVTSSSGTFAASDPLSFNVTTTNSSGYTLSLKSKTGDTDLINSIANSSFASISGSGISADTFSNSDNTAYNNHWGIRPSYYESIANSDGLYYPSPDNDGVILNATDKANTSGVSDIYTIAIGARATYTQPAGAYSNSYILSAVGNYPKQATCTKQYRLQNADGSFPSEYTLDTTEELDIGTTCTYTKSVSDYKYGGATTTNGTSGTTSGVMTSDGLTLSLDFYRDTYALTVSAGSNTSNATGSGTYRWGQTVTVGVTKATNTTCLTYATPTWSQSGTTGIFSSTSGASTNFAMGKGAATVTATSSSSRNTYTITYNNNGGTGTMSSTTGSCGASTTLRANTFTRIGYNFLGWATSSTATSATYTDKQSITLSRTSTLALYAVWEVACDSTVSGTMQDFNPCSTIADGTSGSLTDSRDSQIYTIAKINGQWWMTKNLAIGCNGSGVNYGSSVSSKSLTTADSNVSRTWFTPTALLSVQENSSSDSGYYTAAIQCNSTYGAWYNYPAATAGTITGSGNDDTATKDVCPLNWRLPSGPNKTRNTDLNKLINNRTSGYQDPTDGLTAFNAVAGGYWYYGTRRSTEDGAWWSTTAYESYGATMRYQLVYNSSTGKFSGDGGTNGSYSGYYVRCVHD